MNNIILYGLGGASDNYRVLKYWRFMEQNVTIKDIMYQAWMMVENYPSIREVYAIDNSSELYQDFKRVLKYPSIENNVVFKSIMETRGLLVYENKKKG